MLIRGLSDSSRTLFWTVVVIFFVTYTFGIFGLVMVVSELQVSLEFYAGEGKTEHVERIEGLMQILGGLDKLMYTLVQVLCGDSFHQFMREILVYVQWSWVYFYSYVAVACLVLMNLVTAVIVENAMDTSRNDHEQQVQEKEAKQQRDIKELQHLFTLMDADGSGTLSWDEFKDSFEDERMAMKWMLLDFQQEDCHELFALLDDGDGEIETGEFFDGLQKMRGGASSKDIFRLQKSIEKVERVLEEVLPHFRSRSAP